MTMNRSQERRYDLDALRVLAVLLLIPFHSARVFDIFDPFYVKNRRTSAERWRQAIAEALDQLIADGAKGGRHLILNIHPWLIGHPHRIGYLEDVLEDVRNRNGVWIATTSEIVAHIRPQLTD
jgi:hypothetical protein